MDELHEDGREPSGVAEDAAEAGETPPEAAEAVSGEGPTPGDAPGGPDEEEFQATAPTLPAEMLLNEFNYWLQKLPGGRVALKVAAVISGPMGSAPLPPAYVFVFAPDGWEDFQANVEETRVRQRRNVQVARDIPDIRLPDGVRL